MAGANSANTTISSLSYGYMRLGRAIVAIVAVILLTSCGRNIAELLGSRNLGEISDYGSETTPVVSGSEVDPELEAFWASVNSVADELPSRQASRLIVNIRELRARFDPETAALILKAARRFVSNGDLYEFVEDGSLDLALLLEQRSGDALVRDLEIMIATSAEDFQAYLLSSTTEKPENLAKKQVEDGERLLDLLVAPPILSPKGGSFLTFQEIKMSTATEGATIHYTLDNSEPDASSPIYHGPFIVGENEAFTVVRAIAVHPIRGESEVSLGTFSVNLAVALPPVASHSSGVYSEEVLFSLSTSEALSSIRYTVDGSVPTLESPEFSTEISVRESEHLVLKARVFAPGKRASPVLSRDIRVDVNAPVSTSETSLRIENILARSFTVFWEPAYDDFTPSDEILYRIVLGIEASDVDSFESASSISRSCSSNPPPCISGLLPSQAGVGYHARVLESFTEYHVGLLAIDAAGNSSLLGVTSGRTLQEGL